MLGLGFSSFPAPGETGLQLDLGSPTVPTSQVATIPATTPGTALSDVPIPPGGNRTQSFAEQCTGIPSVMLTPNSRVTQQADPYSSAQEEFSSVQNPGDRSGGKSRSLCFQPVITGAPLYTQLRVQLFPPLLVPRHLREAPCGADQVSQN